MRQKYHFKFIPSFPRMLVSKILERITQRAKLGLQTKTISVCVLMDLDLKATIVMRVRSLIFFIKAETRCISDKLRKWLVIVTEHRRWKPRMAQVIQNTKGTYMWTTMLLLMVHLGTGFFTHFFFYLIQSQFSSTLFLTHHLHEQTVISQFPFLRSECQQN